MKLQTSAYCCLCLPKIRTSDQRDYPGRVGTSSCSGSRWSANCLSTWLPGVTWFRRLALRLLQSLHRSQTSGLLSWIALAKNVMQQLICSEDFCRGTPSYVCCLIRLIAHLNRPDTHTTSIEHFLVTSSVKMQQQRSLFFVGRLILSMTEEPLEPCHVDRRSRAMYMPPIEAMRSCQAVASFARHCCSASRSRVSAKDIEQQLE